VNRHLSALATAVVWWTHSAAAQTAPALPAPPPPPDAAAPVAAPSTAPDASAELHKEVAAQRADIDEQDARIEELERQLKELKRAPAPSAATAPAAKPNTTPAPGDATQDQWPFKVSGYIQAQYESHQDSEDQLAIGGTPLNQDRFLLRRTRLKVSRDWLYGGAMIELDANTVKGPAIGLQHAEVSLAYRNPDHTPLVSLTMGLFDNPFGREVVESPRDRPFMERSFGSREFFPAEPDLGVRLSGQAAWFRYSVAVVNGQPLGDKTGFVLQDPNAHKDVLGRVGVDVAPPVPLPAVDRDHDLGGAVFHERLGRLGDVEQLSGLGRQAGQQVGQRLSLTHLAQLEGIPLDRLAYEVVEPARTG